MDRLFFGVIWSSNLNSFDLVILTKHYNDTEITSTEMQFWHNEMQCAFYHNDNTVKYIDEIQNSFYHVPM